MFVDHYRSRQSPVTVALLFLIPATHPLLIPLVGVPSHLLWWVHVLPVAFLTFQYGRTGGLASLALSTALTFGGELVFGAGYGSPANIETALALTVALLGTNLLVFGFALYARGVTARYQLLFDEVRMGVLRFSKRGRVVDANPAAREILGFRPGELVGTSFADLLPTSDFGSIEELDRLGGWSGTLELPGSEGRRTAHLFLAAVRGADERGHHVLVADRTMEVLQEQEITRQSKLATLGEALAGVAHEPNNPLAVIMSYAELLGFSRPRGPEAAFAVHDLLKRIIRVQQMSVGKSVRLEGQIEWEGRLKVSASKLEQIILNLVANAVYAVKDTGGTVLLSCREHEGQVEIAVRDDGPGVPEDLMEDLFKPFTTTKPPGEGTGLGLAISRRLASSWGGTLEARNRKPRGATFVVRIPLEATRVPALEPVSAAV